MVKQKQRSNKEKKKPKKEKVYKNRQYKTRDECDDDAANTVANINRMKHR